MNIVAENIKQLNQLCESHKVRFLYLFGSYAKGQETKDSDIDLLVKFGEVDLFHYFDNYLSLKEKLQNLFSREIDLVEEQTVKNPFLKESIEESKQLLYG